MTQIQGVRPLSVSCFEALQVEMSLSSSYECCEVYSMSSNIFFIICSYYSLLLV